jgi:hypothetical protein
VEIDIQMADSKGAMQLICFEYFANKAFILNTLRRKSEAIFIGMNTLRGKVWGWGT